MRRAILLSASAIVAPMLMGGRCACASALPFSHPHAKGAKVIAINRPNGGVRLVLVVLTTIDLDRKGRRHSRAAIERLSAAIRGYLAESGEAVAFVLTDRARDWSGQWSRRISLRRLR